jgi:hypothetical protein
MHIGLQVKYPLFLWDFSEVWIISTDFPKSPQYKISWKSFKWESSCSVPADRHDEANSGISRVCGHAYKLKENKVFYKNIIYVFI